GVKRGDGDEEGIYLLAKDLAYNVALDQKEKLEEGLKKMQKKDLYGVSVALNSIDPEKTIDRKICKDAYKHGGSSAGKEADNMCGVQMDSSSQRSNNRTGLAELWNMGGSSATDRGGGYDKSSSETIGPKTSVKISTDINGLTKDEKSKVSSAFARGGEGAEIVEIRSISTTSVMVNACYDVAALQIMHRYISA
ncbi:P44/Msp2 family outer membrane protein, partial [Anaplasma bovis]|uniref:P44/Msp2 family outer membrane protein n=1 Tax=Anaplasma bovis TaxID=186733 RepID=UPI002FF0D555